ncbi:MAG: ATP-binding cassette domain-containing protein [Planctomycetes bacterium]|nr:ATP-binding cassette domain-containing protein [Planctomycetota bacterium]
MLDELSESAVLAGEYFRISEIPQDFSYQPATATAAAADAEGNGLVLDHLRFTYPERPDREILHDITTLIRPGEFVGIAGPSGCGKSSLIKTIAKLEPVTGRIVLDGADLATLSRAYIADEIALIPQSPFLIADTVFNNICYGCRDVPDRAAVREAAKRACIDADIMKMDGDYDFVVSEGGANLSGGQCQRIALARIFLRKPRLLILDEATSALDNTSERHVQAEIERMQREEGVTIISIAHRLTTLKNCDRILVFDRGRIVQEGTYAELTTTPGLFQDMHQGKLR